MKKKKEKSPTISFAGNQISLLARLSCSRVTSGKFNESRRGTSRSSSADSLPSRVVFETRLHISTNPRSETSTRTVRADRICLEHWTRRMPGLEYDRREIDRQLSKPESSWRLGRMIYHWGELLYGCRTRLSSDDRDHGYTNRKWSLWMERSSSSAASIYSTPPPPTR